MTIKTKRTVIFFATSLVIGFCYMYFFTIPYTDKQLIENYKIFDEVNIAGKIESVRTVNHGLTTRLKIENSPATFKFSLDIRDGNRFEEFAEKGDSIIKPSLSNILVLFKNNKAYEYTFNRR
jgi:hypothetical protein